MADCGAGGTTIDRATRALLGASNQRNDVSKHVGALVGHASINHQTAMPAAAPESLLVPQSNHNILTANNAVQMGAPVRLDQQESSWAAAPGAVNGHFMHPGQHHMMHPMQHQQPMIDHAAIAHNQAHHQHMMQQAIFQQQQHMMQQQIFNQHQQMIAKQQLAQTQESRVTENGSIQKGDTTEKNADGKLKDDFENWHEGLDHEDIINQFDDVVVDEEGPRGASIEELAAAWAQAEAEYEELGGQDEEYANLWSGEGANEETKQYEFIHKEKPKEMIDFMDEGMKYFQEGNLKEAIRCFEMELQFNNGDNSRAWRMLGRCHAENDQDPEAISCLEHAVERDPYSTESLLSLGVSYVNELNHEKALENMKAWITHNPKYAGMEMSVDIYGASVSSSRESAFEDVKKLLLSALEFDSTDSEDVYEALGVIYNVIKDYDAAADSFRKALETRPDDYQLWNKLGATLANGSRSDQALPAYHRALQIKPKYARAWLNMAISHSNLQDHDEAARCYLQTLSLNPAANHCWTYLRMALSCSERWDLLPLVFSQDLVAFKEHFDFVLH